MFDKLDKLVCYILIFTLFNSSFQPLYSFPDLEKDVEVSYPVSSRKMSDLSLEDPQINSTRILQTTEADIVSRFVLAPLKTMIRVVSLVKQSVRFALENPGKIITMGLAFQPWDVRGEDEFKISQNQIDVFSTPNPLVAPLPNGNAFLIWYGNQGGDYNIYGRIIAENGTALTNEFLVNQNTSGSQIYPSVTPLRNGRVFTAWEGDQTGNYDIYGRIFSFNGINGIPIGNEFPINQNRSADQYVPVVRTLANGDVFATWQGFQTGDFDVYGRVFSESAVAISNEFTVNQNRTDIQVNPSLTSLENGDAFIVWMGQQEGNFNIYGRVFNASGAPLSNEITVYRNKTSNHYGPSAASFLNGNVIVLWSGNQTGNYDIQGRLFSPNGTTLSTEFPISQNSSAAQGGPIATPSIKGDVFVVWQGIQTGNNAIYGRLLSSNGIFLSDDFGINKNITFSQSFPSVASLSNGNIFVTWEGMSTSLWDIYGRIFDNVTLSSFFYPAPAPLPAPMPVPLPLPIPAPAPVSLLSPVFFTAPVPTPIVVPESTSIFLSTSSIHSSSETGSLRTSDSLMSASTSPSTPSSSSLSQFSSEISNDGPSWQIPAAIGGGIGAAVIIGGVGAIVAKKLCCSKGKKSGKSESTKSDVELVEDNLEKPVSKNVETPASSRVVDAFEPTSIGVTEHPSFVGKIHGDTYEIWKKLYEEEANLLRPLTAIPIPLLSHSEKIKFTLGKGNFGDTYAGSNLKTKEIFAIKEVKGRGAVDESLQEGKIVHSLGNHPNIMPLIDYINFEPSKKSQEPRLYQVMPLAYINGVGFKQLLEYSRHDQREKVVSDSFRQMMMGLDYIHKQGVVHMDIKADNTLYMKDGTLRIADFGKAKQVGDNDQIADKKNLGEIRKFSPEIIDFLRHLRGKQGIASFSGKGADIWAAALYIWELLEDNVDNLFSLTSTKFVSLEIRISQYTYEAFEQFVEKLSLLQGKYSPTLLNLLRQVLAVDPELRIKSPQVIKKLSSGKLSHDERRVVFEQLISLSTENQPDTVNSTPIYIPSDPTQYMPRLNDQQEPKVSLPDGLYADRTHQKKSKVYVPDDLYVH